MTLEDQFELAAPRATVFAAFRDPSRLAPCIDGVSSLEPTGNGSYRAVMQTQVAYITLDFEVSIEVTDSVENESLCINLEGRPRGLTGRLKAHSVVGFEDSIEGTNVGYRTELSLAGKLGTLGQAAIRSKARSMQADFTQRLEALLTSGPEDPRR